MAESAVPGHIGPFFDIFDFLFSRYMVGNVQHSAYVHPLALPADSKYFVWNPVRDPRWPAAPPFCMLFQPMEIKR